MNIFVDVDNTICQPDPNMDYDKVIPWMDRIARINELYDEGHRVTYWTARGTMTGIDWRETTQNQLNEWGAKHHDLILGKPAFDLFIDDKSIHCDRFFNGEPLPENYDSSF